MLAASLEKKSKVSYPCRGPPRSTSSRPKVITFIKALLGGVRGGFEPVKCCGWWGVGVGPTLGAGTGGGGPAAINGAEIGLVLFRGGQSAALACPSNGGGNQLVAWISKL